MPFNVWAPMGPRNRVLHGGPGPPWEEAILRERVAHCKVQGLSTVLCANWLNQARQSWSSMLGHVGQNDTYITLFKKN